MIRSIEEWTGYIHEWAHGKGFYQHSCLGDDVVAIDHCVHISGSIAGQCMLLVTEVAEAVEADREDNVGLLREEVADVAIRLFDLCGALGIDLENEIALKMAKNEDRPFRHGKQY